MRVKPNYFTLDNYSDDCPTLTRIDYTQSVPIWSFDLRPEIDPAEIKRKISDYAAQFPELKPQAGTPVRASYTTDLFVIKRTDAFTDLVNAIVKQCSKISADPCLHWHVGETWCTVYKTFDNVLRHNHGACTLVGVYYAEAENASPIVLDNYKIIPQAGTVLMFPGFLDHKVQTTAISNGARAIFGCNIYMTADIDTSYKNSLQS
jgi:hypothetical protein